MNDSIHLIDGIIKDIRELLCEEEIIAARLSTLDGEETVHHRRVRDYHHVLCKLQELRSEERIHREVFQSIIEMADRL